MTDARQLTASVRRKTLEEVIHSPHSTNSVAGFTVVRDICSPSICYTCVVIRWYGGRRVSSCAAAASTYLIG